MIKKKIDNYLADNHKYNVGQSSFIKQGSTQSELQAHYNDIYEAISEGKGTNTVFLDFAKAFDKVDHEILLKKVKKQGIDGKIRRWIENFF